MQPGMNVGPYRIIEQVGHGGMATVFKAYDPGTDRYVAIKIVSPQFAQHPEFQERFRREAKSIAKLEHPHIIPVHAFGQEGDTAYLVLRYMDTGTLRDRMNHEPMENEETGRLIVQVADALDYAHRNGVIHRDVKPSNVLLDTEGNAYLTDFGIAKIVEATVELTGTGTAMGTPQYMSPEQCMGEKNLTPATDIYSLGVMLYQMVTGHLPFDADTPLAVIHKHLTEPLPPPRQINPQVSERMERVLLKALAKDPKDRFSSAADFALGLRGALRPHSPPKPMPAEIESPVKVDEPARTVKLQTGLRRYWWAAALLVLGLGAGLIFGVPRLLQSDGVQEVREQATAPVEDTQAAGINPPSEEVSTEAAQVEPPGGIDCMGASPGEEIRLLHPWTEDEERDFQTVLQPLVAECGLAIQYQSLSDSALIADRLRVEDPPEAIVWRSVDFHQVGVHQDLSPLGSDWAHRENYKDYWIALGGAGSEDPASREWVGLPLRVQAKSMIWYSPKAFDSFGYQVPRNIGELESLVERMVNDGNTPWAMGLESDQASGWAGSDFIQDLLMTTGGSDYVRRIITGTTPYNRQGVVSAYEQYLRWATDGRYTVGGAQGTLNTPFIDAVFQVVDDPHEALMVYQAAWVGELLRNERPELIFGEDYDFFPFPGGGAVQGAADWLTLARATPASMALVNYLSSEEGARNYAQIAYNLSPNLREGVSHPDPYTARLEAMLLKARGFMPDLGDTIGGEFQSAEWQAIVDVVGGANLQSALQVAAEAQARTLIGR